MMRRPILPRDRAANQAGLAFLTIVACAGTWWVQPHFWPVLTLTIALGYVALAFVAASLLIGPLKLLRRRRNPVNLDLRRDIGIWAGITGCLHVFFGLQVHMDGQILLYFFAQTPGGYAPLLNLFGLSNDAGAAATLVLVGLLVLSNNAALRRLRGPRWKFWQRANYLLFPLAVLHTLGYQAAVPREHLMGAVVIAASALVTAVQIAGTWRYRYQAAVRARGEAP